MKRQKRNTFKNPQQEVQLYHRRVIVITMIVVLFVVSVVSRLAWLQIYHHDLYITLSERSRSAARFDI